MSGKELEYIQQAFDSNYIAPVGPQLDQFEQAFREATGFEYCVAVASGTAAIHLGLRTLGVGPGDVVLASTLTFIGSVVSATYVGAELMFIDSEEQTWNMDPDVLQRAIESLIGEGKKPSVILPTDTYGQTCDLKTIVEIGQQYDIPVLCDCAESLGAQHRGRSTGRGAAVAAFSFNGNKIITTSSGGMVASDNKKLIDECRHLSTQAREPVLHYEHEVTGYNYRMSNILAAIGVGQLGVLQDRVEKKREIHQQYETELSELNGIDFLQEADFGRSNRWLTAARIDPAKFGASYLDVIAALDKENIESRPVWKPMHMQKVFSNCRVFGGQVGQAIYETGICLPCGAGMTSEEVTRVCDVIKSLHGQGN
jgi:dTDP-4-amino-4,6-dideoxygalactose transaminase